MTKAHGRDRKNNDIKLNKDGIKTISSESMLRDPQRYCATSRNSVNRKQ